MSVSSYRALRHITHNHAGYPAGSILDLEECHAQSLLESGAVEPLPQPEPKPILSILASGDDPGFGRKRKR